MGGKRTSRDNKTSENSPQESCIENTKIEYQQMRQNKLRGKDKTYFSISGEAYN